MIYSLLFQDIAIDEVAVCRGNGLRTVLDLPIQKENKKRKKEEVDHRKHPKRAMNPEPR